MKFNYKLFKIIEYNIESNINLFNKYELELLNDKDFINRIENTLLEILSDNKIDYHDIPKIIILLIDIIHEYHKLNNDMDIYNIIKFISECIIYLYNNNLLPEEEKKIFLNVIENSIQLLKIKIKKINLFNRFICFCRKKNN